MSSDQSDQVLVERVQRGDKAAFNLLVQKYQHKMTGIISRYVSNPGDVADVAQDAFIKAYRALPGFRGDSAFYTWLYRIAVNTCKNFLASQGRRPPGTDIDVADAEFQDGAESMRDIASPEKVLISEEIRQIVFDTIETLPEELKMAITLRELDGLSYEEIAELMACPVGTVRSRIFRARDAIDKRIQPLLQR